MFLLSLLANAVLIGFTAELPKAAPDISTWQVIQGAHITRGIVHDLYRSSEDGGWALKFIQTRGICPASRGGDCSYSARYQLSTISVDGEQSYAHRYVVIGPTGVRAEGLIVSSTSQGRYLFYRRVGTKWEEELPGLDSLAGTYVGMLFEITKGLEGSQNALNF